MTIFEKLFCIATCLTFGIQLALAIIEYRILLVLQPKKETTMPAMKPILITAAVVVGVLVLLNKGRNLPGLKQVNDLVSK